MAIITILPGNVTAEHRILLN